MANMVNDPAGEGDASDVVCSVHGVPMTDRVCLDCRAESDAGSSASAWHKISDAHFDDERWREFHRFLREQIR